jgi:DNA-binding NarL/FixJ family response regulator
VAVATALAEPRKVSHLVLYATRARALTDHDTWLAMRSLMVADWEMSRRAMAAVVLEGASSADMEAFVRLSLAAAEPDVAIALQDAAFGHDYTDLLGRLQVPTLVLQRAGDPIVTAEEARDLAARIPGATLELLDGACHIHTVGDSVAVADSVNAFTAGGSRRPSAGLSARESEVLELVASGSTNAEVAERLVLSVRTVERHLLNTYRKLGVRGRAEATAVWLGGRGPEA